jgi:hypothetical protein
MSQRLLGLNFLFFTSFFMNRIYSHNLGWESELADAPLSELHPGRWLSLHTNLLWLLSTATPLWYENRTITSLQ